MLIVVKEFEPEKIIIYKNKQKGEWENGKRKNVMYRLCSKKLQ